jgi:hypothetical protein
MRRGALEGDDGKADEVNLSKKSKPGDFIGYGIEIGTLTLGAGWVTGPFGFPGCMGIGWRPWRWPGWPVTLRTWGWAERSGGGARLYLWRLRLAWSWYPERRETPAPALPEWDGE